MPSVSMCSTKAKRSRRSRSRWASPSSLIKVPPERQFWGPPTTPSIAPKVRGATGWLWQTLKHLCRQRRTHMKREIGLWIDHREAVIVILTDEGEEMIRLKSDMEKHIR